jgi:hypothetical protein
MIHHAMARAVGFALIVCGLAVHAQPYPARQ